MLARLKLSRTSVKNFRYFSTNVNMKVGKHLLANSIYTKDDFYSSIKCDIKEAVSLPPDIYNNNEYHLIEEEVIWKNNWWAACHSQEIKAKSVKVIDVGNKSYIITRDRNNKLYAFNNVCIHRGSKLCSKSGQRPNIVCPYHHWTYKLNGELRSTPYLEQNDHLNKYSGKLHEIYCQEFGSVVWLNPTPKTITLEDNLSDVKYLFGDLKSLLQNYNLDEYELIDTKIYNVNCNYKILIENFLDWYHINAIHPELSKFSRTIDHYTTQENGNFSSFVTNPLTDSGGVGDRHNWKISNNLTSFEKESAKFYGVFPNICYTLYPHSLYTLIALPDKNNFNKSYEILALLQHPNSKLDNDTIDTYKSKQKLLMDFVCQVNDEDVGICERVQNGIGNGGYNGGRFCLQEVGTHRYQLLLSQYMTGKYNILPSDPSSIYSYKKL